MYEAAAAAIAAAAENAPSQQLPCLSVPMPLLPPLVEQKISQLTNNPGASSNAKNGSSAAGSGSSKANKRQKSKKYSSQCADRNNSPTDDSDDALLFNGCLVATEFQSHWLANHYPQMLRPSVWDEDRRTYEKLLDIGTKLCRDKEFELALRCFMLAVPPNAADHAYVCALRGVVKLSSEMYEDAVVDAATVMLIFLTNTMWHRLFPHFRLAFTNAHLVVAVAFFRLGYVSAAKAWADRFVCMAESLPGQGAEMLGALCLTELIEEVRLIHRTGLAELANFRTVRQINVEDLKYHAQRVLLGGEKLSSTQILFSIVHISLNYGYFLTENNLPYRDETLINTFRFHMGLLQLPVIGRIFSVNSAFGLSDNDCQFFSILSRFLLLPMCYCMSHNVCEEVLTDATFVSFLSTVAAELAADNAAIVQYTTQKPCFAFISPVFSTILWAVWHRAPMGRARMIAGVSPFNDIEWHTEVLLAEMGANGPPNAWLRLLDFFAVFYESFSMLPAFRAEVKKMPVEKLAGVVNKLAWLWSALFQYSIGGCLASKEPFAESLEKASSDTSLVFWLLIAKDEHFLKAMVRSHFWLHIASHMEFMTKDSCRNLLAPNVRTGRLKCIIDLLIAMLGTGNKSEWPPVFDGQFFQTIAKCLADLIFVGINEFSCELPLEITWLLLQLTTLLSLHFPDDFPNELARLCGQEYGNIAVRLFSFLKQPPSEAIFKSAVTCTMFLLRRVPDKVHKASKKLKLKDVNTLFSKLVTGVVSLYELMWDEIFMESACEFMDVLLTNERCSLAIRSDYLFLPQNRLIITSSDEAVATENEAAAGLSVDNDEPVKQQTNWDVLIRVLTSFSEDIDSGKLETSAELNTKTAVSHLLEKLLDISTKSKQDVDKTKHLAGDLSVLSIKPEEIVGAVGLATASSS